VAPIIKDNNDQWAKVNGDGGNMADDEDDHRQGVQNNPELVSELQPTTLDSF